MAKTRQIGQFLLIAMGLTLANGCSSPQVATAPPADPLHGVMVPPGMPQPPSTPKADASSQPYNPQASNQPGAPAVPASASSSNPATLAPTSWQGPLGRPLAISDNNSSGPPFLPNQSNYGSQGPQALGVNMNPKVMPVPDATPPIPPAGPSASWQNKQPNVQPVSATQPASDEALAKQLENAGVINQSQANVPEGVRLTCYVSRGPGQGLRSVEWTAPTYAAAAQVILTQLQTERQP